MITVDSKLKKIGYILKMSPDAVSVDVMESLQLERFSLTNRW